MIKYIPPLGLHWLTPLYDPVHAALGWHRAYTPALIAQLGLHPHHRLLDLGCGTATLMLALKRRFPEAVVVGVDLDAKVLAQARQKMQLSGVTITVQRGTACNLPYADGAFDVVVSTLALHHLGLRQKRLALAEAWRVLRPGGQLVVVDFGRPRTPLAAMLAAVTYRCEEIGDQVRGLLPCLLREAGFDPVEECEPYLFGALTMYHAHRPLSIADSR